MNNGTEGLKKWGVMLSIGVSLLAFGKSVFFAGGDVARIEEHLRYNDAKLDRLEAECAKAREIDLQIQAIKESQHRLEIAIDRATEQIESDQPRRRAH